MSMPSNQIWIENIIDKYYDLIKMPIHYFHIGEGEHIFARKHIDTWLDTGRRIYVHLYYQHDRVNEDYQNFLENLAKLKEEIEEGKKPSQNLFNNYSKYLIITNTSNKVTRVEYNNEKILTYQKKYCGFYCLLSPNVKDAIEALKIYRNRDNAEKCFDDLKNSVDSNLTRVHTTTRIEARIFIQFLSLIYTSKIRSMLQKSSPIKNMSLQEIFDDLNILIRTKIKRGFGSICTEADKRTQKILDWFEIQWPL
jgi:transposase